MFKVTQRINPEKALSRKKEAMLEIRVCLPGAVAYVEDLTLSMHSSAAIEGERSVKIVHAERENFDTRLHDLSSFGWESASVL
jgi:hypothetical protein